MILSAISRIYMLMRRVVAMQALTLLSFAVLLEFLWEFDVPATPGSSYR
jgi:hypothetical protein